MHRISLMVFISLMATAAIAADIGKTKKIKGGLDNGAIDAQVKRHIRQISACYENELNASTKLFSGTIQTHFTVGASGKVIRVSILSNTLNHTKVETCLLGIIRRMVFPAPQGGGTVTVDYPFTFAPPTKVSQP